MARGTLVMLVVVQWLRCLDAFTAQLTHLHRPRERNCSIVRFGPRKSAQHDDAPSVRELHLREEAKQLLEKARAIRSELPDPVVTQYEMDQETLPAKASPWHVPLDQSTSKGADYRLYVDIGREEGTWMDPRWGASNRRIEFSLDVKFTTPSENDSALANEQERGRMVKDNFGGKSSNVYVLKSATAARLRSGFDAMKCYGGAYRIDAASNGGSSTARFYIQADGTPEQDSSYGDVFVPKGCLFFSLPSFGGVTQLSKKEGIVTVRQTGWHTGWRREESRIVGTFRAVPIDDAKRRDRF